MASTWSATISSRAPGTPSATAATAVVSALTSSSAAPASPAFRTSLMALDGRPVPRLRLRDQRPLHLDARAIDLHAPQRGGSQNGQETSKADHRMLCDLRFVVGVA